MHGIVSKQAFLELLRDLLSSHSCGLKLNVAHRKLNLSDSSRYVLYPFLLCCYHGIISYYLDFADSGQFFNFPMSAAANAAYAAVCSQRKPPLSSSSSSSSSIPSAEAAAPVSQAFLTPCSLRLAAQETRCTFSSPRFN